MPPAAQLLPVEDRRWLHDKYERLAEEEGDLAASRTSYFAAIAAVLVTGLVVAASDLIGTPVLLVLFATFFSGFGVLIAVVWAVLFHRTTDAQNLWREAALRLEEMDPPIEASVPAPITLRSGRTVTVDLARPYHAHAERFDAKNHISWLDRVDPSRLSEVMPLALLVIWGAALVVVWSWFLWVR
jgi:hypothetical protein